MKRVLLVIMIQVVINSLNAQSLPGEEVGRRIADRMKDSLALSAAQSDSVYQANMWLFQQKQVMRQLHAGSDSLGIYFQQVENKRDSLYQTVLSATQYELYRQKKIQLIHNN